MLTRGHAILHSLCTYQCLRVRIKTKAVQNNETPTFVECGFSGVSHKFSSFSHFHGRSPPLQEINAQRTLRSLEDNRVPIILRARGCSEKIAVFGKPKAWAKSNQLPSSLPLASSWPCDLRLRF